MKAIAKGKHLCEQIMLLEIECLLVHAHDKRPGST